MSNSVQPHRRQPTRLPLPGILQARTLEWVAISFSNAWKWKVKVKSLRHVQLLVTPWTAAYQAPPSMGVSRQEYWSGVPLPSPLLHYNSPKSLLTPTRALGELVGLWWGSASTTWHRALAKVMHEAHTDKLMCFFPPYLSDIWTAINITDHVTVTSYEDSLPLLSFTWRFLHLTGLFCWCLRPNWTFTSKNIQGSTWGPFLCNVPEASVNTSRPKLPSASLYFRCLFWTPGLYIQLPMWWLRNLPGVSDAVFIQNLCLHMCVNTHRAILSPLLLVSVNGTTIYSAHPARCLRVLPDSLLRLIPTANITSVWCSVFLDAVFLSHLTLLSLQEPLSGL